MEEHVPAVPVQEAASRQKASSRQAAAPSEPVVIGIAGGSGSGKTTVLEQYERTVRLMHLEFVEPSKRRADVIIPRGGHDRVAIEMVLARLETLLGDGGAKQGE